MLAGAGFNKPASRPRDRLIRECGYKPTSIAAITFTNGEAKKLQERAAKLLAGKDGKGLFYPPSTRWGCASCARKPPWPG